MPFLRVLLVLALAAFNVSAFLSHWSLADGAPRNSLHVLLEGEGHRPFAYRLLAISVVKAIDAVTPDSTRNILADSIAPRLRAQYVEPLLKFYEPQIPGMTERAHHQWENKNYRSSYVLMVALIFISLVGAMLLLHRVASLLGANDLSATMLIVVYSLIFPTMFLNGGYFYDFTEQLCVLAFICCIYEGKWWLSGIVLILMQLNKETALLMPLFMLPHAWQAKRWLGLKWMIAYLVMCVFLLLFIRLYYANLPGQSSEWNLQGNLVFWLSLASWQRTIDFYAVGIELPRIMFLLFSLSALGIGWRRGPTPNVISATIAFFVLAVLLLMMGYTDEFRNISLALPLLLLLLIEQRNNKNTN